MQIHLSDITFSEGKTMQVTAELEMNRIIFQLDDFPILDKEPVELTVVNTGDRVLKKSPVELTVSNTGNKVLEIRGEGTVTVGIPCDRCLEQVSVKIPYHIKKKLDMKLTEEERINDLDESSYLTGMDLDVDRLVYLEVLMGWPLKTLCSEDCKGICKSCGKNLNEGPCGCAEEPKDPRMAAISDIFSKFKEV